MNICQKHLVDNYNKYVNIFTKKYKDRELAKAAVHRSFAHLSKTKTIPDNIETFLYVAINRAVYNERRQYIIDSYVNFYESQDAFDRAIEQEYDPVSEIDAALTFKKEYKKIIDNLPKISTKAQLIINEHIFKNKTMAVIAKENNFNLETTKATYRQNLIVLRDLITGKIEKIQLKPKTKYKNNKITIV